MVRFHQGYGWFCSALVIAAGVSSPLLAAPLRSPWSDKPVTETKAPFTCTSVEPIGPDLTMDGFYRTDDPTHSQIDPVRQAAYSAAAAPVKGDAEAIVMEANAYRTKRSHAAAVCVVRQIVSLAQQHAMTGRMSSNQAYYVQGWIAGALAIAFLKVEGSGAASTEDRKAIANWLVAIGKQTRDYYDARLGKGDGANNHLYWAGLELAAIGVMAQDREDFDWGMRAYDRGIADIQPDGTLQREMDRAARALHYHLYALAPLVLLAEFGEANRLDLYARSDGAIQRLERVSVRGLQDPSLFEKATGVKQEAPDVPSGDAIAWAPPYERRFPDPTLRSFIQHAPSLHSLYLGGLPPE
jgi:poly(beta-D-mannuronate) lyase